MTTSTSIAAPARAPRLSAPAPADPDAENLSAEPAIDDDLHALFEQWSWWAASRRFYAPPPSAGNILGKLSSKTRAFRRVGGPDAPCSAELAALHLAILGQPRDALDTRVFFAYYGERAAVIKVAAARLDISRQHFYRLLRAFCIRVRAASQQILADNLAAAQALPHAPESVTSTGDKKPVANV